MEPVDSLFSQQEWNWAGARPAGPVAATLRREVVDGPARAVDFVVFIFPEKPGFSLCVDGHALDLRASAPPHAVAVNPGLPFQADRAGPVGPFYLAHLEAGYLGSLAEELYDMPSFLFPEPRGAVPPTLVEDARRLAAEQLRQTADSRFMADSLSTVFAVDLLQALVPEGRLVHVAGRCHPGVREARRLIRARFRSPMRVKDLAVCAGLGTSQFMAVFKRDTGLTPHEYLRRVRIGEAKRLLRAGRDVGSTCRAVGFASLGGFGEAFTEVAGMSPQRFRRDAAWREERRDGE
jgi:AraC-like DNA-binding protein